MELFQCQYNFFLIKVFQSLFQFRSFFQCKFLFSKIHCHCSSPTPKFVFETKAHLLPQQLLCFVPVDLFTVPTRTKAKINIIISIIYKWFALDLSFLIFVYFNDTFSVTFTRWRSGNAKSKMSAEYVSKILGK